MYYVWYFIRYGGEKRRQITRCFPREIYTALLFHPHTDWPCQCPTCGIASGTCLEFGGAWGVSLPSRFSGFRGCRAATLFAAQGWPRHQQGLVGRLSVCQTVTKQTTYLAVVNASAKVFLERIQRNSCSWSSSYSRLPLMACLDDDTL